MLESHLHHQLGFLGEPFVDCRNRRFIAEHSEWPTIPRLADISAFADTDLQKPSPGLEDGG